MPYAHCVNLSRVVKAVTANVSMYLTYVISHMIKRKALKNTINSGSCYYLSLHSRNIISANESRIRIVGHVAMLQCCTHGRQTERHKVITKFCFNSLDLGADMTILKRIKTYGVTTGLTFQSLAVTLRTTRFNIQKFYMLITLHLCVLCGSQNKQQLLPYTALTNWFF